MARLLFGAASLLTLVGVILNGFHRGGVTGAAAGLARNRLRAAAIRHLVAWMRRAGL